MTFFGNTSKRVFSLLLALVLAAGLLVPGIPQAGAKALSGEWEKISISDGGQNLNVYALVLDDAVRNCTSFDLDVEVSMKANAHCSSWQIWLGSNGKYTKSASLYLPGGDGNTSTTVKLSPAQSFDAVAITPTAAGGYSWSMYFEISNVVTTGSGGSGSPSGSGKSDKSSIFGGSGNSGGSGASSGSSSSGNSGGSGGSSGSGSSGGTIQNDPYSSILSGQWEKVTINSSTVYALVFDTPLRQCTQLSVDVDVEMYYNTSCKEWKIWGGINGGGFSELGTLSLPAGNGEGSTTLYFSSPKNLDSIAITPVRSGGFSWSMSMAVYNAKCK